MEWRRDPHDGWLGRVAYVVEDDGMSVLVESWLPAAALTPVALTPVALTPGPAIPDG